MKSLCNKKDIKRYLACMIISLPMVLISVAGAFMEKHVLVYIFSFMWICFFVKSTIAMTKSYYSVKNNVEVEIEHFYMASIFGNQINPQMKRFLLGAAIIFFILLTIMPIISYYIGLPEK